MMLFLLLSGFCLTFLFLWAGYHLYVEMGRDDGEDGDVSGKDD